MRMRTLGQAVCAAGPLLAACLTGGAAAAEPDEPWIGGAVEAAGWRAGPLLAADGFDDASSLEEWVLQVQPPVTPGNPAGRVTVADGRLDLFLPGVGATAWYAEPFEGPVAVSYRVTLPSASTDLPRIQPRDVNTFVHATAPPPLAPGELLTAERFTGWFPTYHPIHAYYTSTGGGGNTTTRMRVYPRALLPKNPAEPFGEPLAHVALIGRDGDEAFLLEPDRDFLVQIVAADGLVQYSVDRRVVYEIRPGEPLTVQDADGDESTIHAAAYDDAVPVHDRGHVGLRAVMTHQRIDDFRVWRLERPEPIETRGPSPDPAAATDGPRN